jgi:hypothetical protein
VLCVPPASAAQARADRNFSSTSARSCRARRLPRVGIGLRLPPPFEGGSAGPVGAMDPRPARWLTAALYAATTMSGKKAGALDEARPRPIPRTQEEPTMSKPIVTMRTTEINHRGPGKPALRLRAHRG